MLRCTVSKISKLLSNFMNKNYFSNKLGMGSKWVFPKMLMERNWVWRESAVI